MWFIWNPLSPERTQNLLIMELHLAPRTHTNSLSSSLFSLSSISMSFCGSQLISSPQLQSLFHQQKELHRLLKAMPLSALLPSPHYTQWRDKTSLSLCLSAPNWLRLVGAGGRAGLFQPRWSDRWTRLEPSGFKCHSHLAPVKAVRPWPENQSCRRYRSYSAGGGGHRRAEGLCSRKLTQHWRGMHGTKAYAVDYFW